MAKQIKPYESIIEQLQREYGESYQTSFTNDKAVFINKNMNKPLTSMQQSKFNLPVGGNTKDTATTMDPREKEQFLDSNSQLSLKPSSTIQSAAYWADRQYLVVSFKSGHTYSYDKVSLRTIMDWQHAGSAGSYFYYNIRTSYSYQKMG